MLSVGLFDFQPVVNLSDFNVFIRTARVLYVFPVWALLLRAAAFQCFVDDIYIGLFLNL